MNVILLVSVLTTTIVYSAFSAQLQIQGDAVLRAKSDIRITGITSAKTGGAIETYNSKYTKDTVSLYATLPASATITYSVQITNTSTKDYIVSAIQAVSNNNSNITITTNLNKNDLINKSSAKTFTITLKNSTSSQQVIALVNKYTFVVEEDPTITMDNLPTTHTKGNDYAITYTHTVGASGLKSVSCASNVNGAVNNLSTLAAGAHTITCTVTANSGKTKSASKTTTITYVAYSITNLLPDGSFENKRWDTVCTYDTTYKKYGSYSCKIIGVASQPEKYTNTLDTMPLESTHKYYSRVEGYQTAKTASESVQIYWPSGPNGSMGTTIFVSVGNWNMYSFVVNNRSNWSNGNYFYRIDYNNNYADGIVYLDGAMLVDLTATFGAGNEPDKAWCDTNIKYFDGTITIYK